MEDTFTLRKHKQKSSNWQGKKWPNFSEYVSSKHPRHVKQNYRLTAAVYSLKMESYQYVLRKVFFTLLWCFRIPHTVKFLFYLNKTDCSMCKRFVAFLRDCALASLFSSVKTPKSSRNGRQQIFFIYQPYFWLRCLLERSYNPLCWTQDFSPKLVINPWELDVWQKTI